MSSLRLLRALLPPPRAPSEAARPSEWPALEARLGVRLPADYRGFIESYGTGSIDDFLWVLNPSSVNDDLELVSRGQATLDAMTVLRRAGHLREDLKLFPEPGGLLPWGVTENGDVLCWRVRGAPARWRTTVQSSNGLRFEHHELNFSGLLTGLLDGSVSSSLRVNLDDDPPTFTPWIPPKKRARRKRRP